MKGRKKEIRVTLSTSTVPTPKEEVHLITTKQPEAHRIHTELKMLSHKEQRFTFP